MLMDFGIALAMREAGGTRLTEAGLSSGTPQYMNPEHATGDRHLDGRTDEYSLLAVFYEMRQVSRPSPAPRRRRSSPSCSPSDQRLCDMMSSFRTWVARPRGPF